MGERVWPKLEEAPLTPKEAARIAGQAYTEASFKDGSVPFRQVPDGGRVKVLGRDFIVVDRLEDSETGLDAYLLKDPDRNFGVVAYRGTDGQFQDYIADAQYVVGQVPGQARLASEQFQKWRDKYHNSIGHWAVTGHSLGGMNAQYVLAENGEDIEFAYNFSGPDMYHVLSEEGREKARQYGDRLYNLGSYQDWVFMHNRKGGYVQGWGYTGYMDIADSGAMMDFFRFHHLDDRYGFGEDGYPVALEVEGLDEFLGSVLGGGVWTEDKARKIKLNASGVYAVMDRQLRAQRHLETVKAHTGVVLGQMEEAFEKVVGRFCLLEGIGRDDVLQVAYESGALPKDNVDVQALEVTVGEMDKRIEENRDFVKSLVRVAEAKIAFDEMMVWGFNLRL